MSILEFENTQGIMLQYGTATVLHRTASYIIDMIILALFMTILSLIFGSAGETTVIVVLGIVFFFYTLFMELLNNGRSIGKMLVGLKVVRIDGRPPTGYDYLTRWMFRWVDIYMSLGALAAMTIGATPRGQRIGDLLADTTVIHVKNLRVPLKKLLNLNRLESYKPQYELAGILDESQVLLAKETLVRANKYKNSAHLGALDKVATRLSQVLQVEKPANTEQFIQTVIKDYIALTR
jgi:uncharacterized RDD family membrane protein YckC